MTNETPRMPHVGDVVEEKYELLRRIGKGGMGVVYEARSLVLQRSVALKFLHPDMADNEKLVERFQREAKMAAAISHPCVTYVFDVGWTADRLPYMAMELLEGQSLAAEIRSAGAMAIARAVHIGGRVLDALEAAHQLGVVHRDLKPENVFLARQGTQEMVKVLDFGISKLLGGDSGATLTQTGTFLGTPAYMSPEQLRSARDVDPRADLYALGAVLYEMLAGRQPYRGETFTEVVFKIISEEPEPLAKLRPGVGPALASVVERAMQKDPARRWQTADAMRSALESAVSDEPEPGEVQPTPLAWELPLASHDTVAAEPAAHAPARPASGMRAAVAATPAACSAAAMPAVRATPPGRRVLLIGAPLVAFVGVLTAGIVLWAQSSHEAPAPMLTSRPAVSAVTSLPPLPPYQPRAVVPAPACRQRLVVTTPGATIRLGAEQYTGAVDLPAACGVRATARVTAPGHEPAEVELVAAEGPARALALGAVPAPAPRPTPSTSTSRPQHPRPARDGANLEANPF